jgi:oxygen-dependent protoporphyrinogen oxidase
MFRLVDALAADCARLGVDLRLDAPATIEPGGVRVAGSPTAGTVLRAAGAEAGRRVTLVTLAVDDSALDDAPRGTGVLVAAGAPDVGARALTHLTAKWRWVADAMPGLHALRLSYDEEPRDAIGQAAADAGILLGVPELRVIDATVATWTRGVLGGGTGLDAVGETVAGTGLAAVVAQAEEMSRRLAISSGIAPRGGAEGRMEG